MINLSLLWKKNMIRDDFIINNEILFINKNKKLIENRI